MFAIDRVTVFIPVVVLLLVAVSTARTIPGSCDRLRQPVRCGVPKVQMKGALPSRASEAIRGEFPWQVALYHRNDSNLIFKCGGSLISERLVLTAAHCVTNQKTGYEFPVGRLKIELGVHELGVVDECIQEVQVGKIHLHPQYRVESKEHDLALLELERTVVFTTRVLPICLDMSEKEHPEFYQQQGKVAGWGFTEFDSISNWLRMTELPFVTHNTCLRSNRPVFGNTIYDGMFCAGFANGSSVCNGDSGGGLVTFHRDHWVLSGIVSFAEVRSGTWALCNSKEYNGFVKVRYYRNWLKKSMEEIAANNPTTPAGAGKQDKREYQQSCGKRQINKRPLIVNGVRSLAGEWPWHVAVHEMVGRVKEYICGGSLISDQIVMTAAHCLLDKNQRQRRGAIIVQLGQTDLFESSTHMREILVEKVSPHEAHNLINKANDIALLELKSSVTFNEYIQPICLPTEQESNWNPVGQLGSIVGWGFRQPNLLTLSDFLISTKLRVVGVEKCSPGLSFGLKTNGKICLGAANNSYACNGDSGGGLFFEKDGVWTIRGVISALDTVDGVCNPNGFLTVTDTGYFLRWVKNMVNAIIDHIAARQEQAIALIQNGTNLLANTGLNTINAVNPISPLSPFNVFGQPPTKPPPSAPSNGCPPSGSSLFMSAFQRQKCQTEGNKDSIFPIWS